MPCGIPFSAAVRMFSKFYSKKDGRISPRATLMLRCRRVLRILFKKPDVFPLSLPLCSGAAGLSGFCSKKPDKLPLSLPLRSGAIGLSGFYSKKADMFLFSLHSCSGAARFSGFCSKSRMYFPFHCPRAPAPPDSQNFVQKRIDILGSFRYYDSMLYNII